MGGGHRGRGAPQHGPPDGPALTQAPPQKGTPLSMKSIPTWPRRTMSSTLPKPRWMRPMRIWTVCGKREAAQPGAPHRPLPALEESVQEGPCCPSQLLATEKQTLILFF